MAIRGVIFDLDGTLIDSRLDFDAMRSEMGFDDGQPILEGIEALPQGELRQRCIEILTRHERRGAESSTMMPGARELLERLSRSGIATAILTRNSRAMTDLALARLEVVVSLVVTREDAPPKPDPTGLLQICSEWEMDVSEVLFVGDFRFDLEAGRAAGVATVLYAPEDLPDYAGEADFVVRRLPEIGSMAGLDRS